MVVVSVVGCVGLMLTTAAGVWVGGGVLVVVVGWRVTVGPVGEVVGGGGCSVCAGVDVVVGAWEWRSRSVRLSMWALPWSLRGVVWGRGSVACRLWF